VAAKQTHQYMQTYTQRRRNMFVKHCHPRFVCDTMWIW